MKPKVKTFFKNFLFYVLVGSILTGIFIPVGAKSLEAHAATVCPIEIGYERVSKGTIKVGRYAYPEGDAIRVSRGEYGTDSYESYTTDSVTIAVPSDWLNGLSYRNGFYWYKGDFWFSPIGCELYNYTPTGDNIAWGECVFCSTQIKASSTYVNFSDWEDYSYVSISARGDGEYSVQDMGAYTKSQFLYDVYRSQRTSKQGNGREDFE